MTTVSFEIYDDTGNTRSRLEGLTKVQIDAESISCFREDTCVARHSINYLTGMLYAFRIRKENKID